jgi:hypothetical protein
VAAEDEERAALETPERSVGRDVYRMRRRRILRLGYGREMTELLADSATVDLHVLEAMVAAGCDLCTAAKIVL